jgi:hypothetical protein
MGFACKKANQYKLCLTGTGNFVPPANQILLLLKLFNGKMT